ncbi:glycosyl transferase [Cylindrospermopsis raciborskii CENA303]|uniref:Glycosyl transferase n=1 Tax=Cylindrospermopsis raciborskii CENA303 TaxID=1170769 RepID=A0A1X4G9Y9_9CYAN|nr:glycosyl transferase [Cylindrospermopsis raciborskii]OSO93968.1 glycosyl transferase [Cylindrospermopsis raciborskii CENA303]
MKRPTVYISITNHGFGHTTRTASIAATIQKLCPDVLLILATTAPRWLLDSYIPGDFIWRQVAFDVGVIQADSLIMDKKTTLEKLREIKKQQNSLIAREVNFLKQNRVDLILADVPFLAGGFAKAANIPCWMISNFGWDFIYEDWGGEFTEIANWIRDWYHESDLLWRLPFHEAMSAFPQVRDIGLTGGSAKFSPEEIRSRWGIHTPLEKTILLTFGGLGIQAIPYNNISQFPDWQFITPDAKAPNLPNLIKIENRQYRPVDFMPICGKIVSKPGYSTFAEAILLGVPIITIPRDEFAEGVFLLEGIENYHHHQIIHPRELFGGDWDFLHESPQPPKQSQPIDKNGNETLAKAVINYLQESS